MIVEVLLKNPESCDGCPCMNSDCENGASCNLGFYSEGSAKYAVGSLGIERPKECKEKYGT